MIADLIDKGVTDDELARAKRRMLAAAIYAQDSQMALARAFGQALATGRSVADVQDWLNRIEAVTADQVVAAAKKYLDLRRSVTGYLVGVPPRTGRDPQEIHDERPAHCRLRLRLSLFAGGASATTIQRVVSPKGIEAWLVEEDKVPLIAMSFAFVGGASQDPAGKPGVANMVSGLLDEGAGDLDSQAFQAALDDYSIELSFDADHDAFYGSVRTLVENRDETAKLLKLALTKPRFDDEPVERIRAQIVSGIKRSERDPDTIASDALMATRPFRAIPMAGRSKAPPTASPRSPPTTCGRLREEFARDNLKVAVVGAIDAADPRPLLDEVFGDLPIKAELAESPETEPGVRPASSISR